MLTHLRAFISGVLSHKPGNGSHSFIPNVCPSSLDCIIPVSACLLKKVILLCKKREWISKDTVLGPSRLAGSSGSPPQPFLETAVYP